MHGDLKNPIWRHMMAYCQESHWSSWIATFLTLGATLLLLRVVVGHRNRHQCSAPNERDDDFVAAPNERHSDGEGGMVRAVNAAELTALDDNLRGKRIVITGGCGMIGSRAAAHFVERGADVLILDAVQPHPSRVVGGAAYSPCIDLGGGASAAATLDRVLTGADAVIHTAGLVVLSHQPSLLRKVHVDATRALLESARRCGIDAFVHVSTAGVLAPNPSFTATACTVGASAPSVAPRDALSCYGRSKARAERIVLRADDDSGATMRTIALRLPGVFGLSDAMMAEPLLRGEVPAMPVPPMWRPNYRRDGAMLDVLYVENAAAALCAAAAALLGTRREQCAGRVFNITNDEPLFIRSWSRAFAAALNDAGVTTPAGGPISVPAPLPYSLAYIAALLSEIIFSVLGGVVPYPTSPFWNLTRATLFIATCDQVLETRETRDVLGFTPPLDNAASFADFAQRVQERREFAAASAELNDAIAVVSHTS